MNLPQSLTSISSPFGDFSELGIHDAMTCQELLAFSVAFSAALPTGQSTLESFYNSLARCDPQAAEIIRNRQNIEQKRSNYGNEFLNTTATTTIHPNMNGSTVTSNNTNINNNNNNSTTTTGNNQINNNLNIDVNSGQLISIPTTTPPTITGNYMIDYSCCYDLYQNALSPLGTEIHGKPQRSKFMRISLSIYYCTTRVSGLIRRYVRRLVEHKYFQQGILLAILINTLSMGIEYHNQPEELTVIVETSNIVFSVIFAIEMMLKVLAEGPFGYIANGFNVFDGVIVILRYYYTGYSQNLYTFLLMK